jgi:hypothetical protein
MDIDSNALTLAQYAQQSNDPLATMVVNSLYMNGSVLAEVPIITKPTLKMNGARMDGNLPTVNWRKLNESSVTTSGTLTPFSESIALLANNIDVDIAFLRDQNAISDPRVAQLNMWIASLSYDTNDKFFNNNALTGDIDAPLGIRYRLDNATAFGKSTACKINGNGVVMSNSLTAATAGQFVELVDQALQEVGAPDGNGCVIYCNRLLHRRWHRAIKIMGAGGGFDMSRDAFDRQVLMYRNAQVRVIGVKSDQSTEIITSTETDAGLDGSSDHTSLYVVRYGEDYFQPWQMAPLSVRDLGILPNEPTQNRVFVDWSLGYVDNHTRSIARVYNIGMA